MNTILATSVFRLLGYGTNLHHLRTTQSCFFYNINTTKTTLDESTRGNYSELGPNSPIRYNRIKDAILYGITRMDIDLDITDFGLEGTDISGEAYVLPNTFIPYPGDFFTINQLNKPWCMCALKWTCIFNEDI